MVPLVSASSSRLLSGHPHTGASTGHMKHLRGDWPALVAEATRTSSSAIELVAMAEPELPELLAWLAGRPRLPFRWVSVHGPSKQRVMSDADLAAQLQQLPSWVTAIVLHPDQMTDPAAYAVLGRRLAVENMDDRKPYGQTADDLDEVFAQLPEARLCFDIAHAGVVDPTLRGGAEILGRFTERLSHVHLSSLDADSHHVPLTPADERRFADLLRGCADVPWILEAPLPS